MPKRKLDWIENNKEEAKLLKSCSENKKQECQSKRTKWSKSSNKLINIRKTKVKKLVNPKGFKEYTRVQRSRMR